MTFVGRPWTMQEIGLPTYWVAVISSEHVNSSTVVKWLCMRKSTESVMISCRFRYLLSPPSSLYMIVPMGCYRGWRFSSKEDNDEDAFRGRGFTSIVVRCRAPAPPPPTQPTPRAILERARGHLSSRWITNLSGGSEDHEDVPSTGTNERSSSTALSRERKQQNETRERHERARLSTRRASASLLFSPPSVSPSTGRFAFLFYCPLSLCLSFLLSLFLSFSLPPSVPFFYGLSFSLRNPLSPPGVLPPLDSPYEIGHRTTLDEFPTSPRRVPVSLARDRRFTRPRESFSERGIKAPFPREGEGYGEHEAQVASFVSLLATSVSSSSSFYPRHASAITYGLSLSTSPLSLLHPLFSV